MIWYIISLTLPLVYLRVCHTFNLHLCLWLWGIFRTSTKLPWQLFLNTIFWNPYSGVQWYVEIQPADLRNIQQLAYWNTHMGDILDHCETHELNMYTVKYFTASVTKTFSLRYSTKGQLAYSKKF